MKGIRTLLRHVLAPWQARRAYRFVMRDWTALSDLQACAEVIATMRFTRNLRPELLPHPEAERLLVLAPHPDDEMIGVGGTLIKALADGSRVRVLYLTSGGETPEECQRREDEAQVVAARVGFEAEFLRQPALRISTGVEAVEELCRRIVDFDPEALFVTFLLDDHDDHRRASELLMIAAESGRLNVEMPLWAYQVYTAVIPNVLVNITEVHQAKAEAIALYASQLRTRNWPHFALGLNAYNSRLLRGDPAPRYAEAFFVVPLKEYAALCRSYFDRSPPETYYLQAYRSAPGRGSPSIPAIDGRHTR